jgi:hypothetical protein
MAESVDEVIQASKLVQDTFKNKPSTMIFPIFGNHDSYPLNQLDFNKGNQALNDTK